MRERDDTQAADPGRLIAVLVPVLGRPGNAAPLHESLRGTSTARLVFVCSPGDRRQIAACRAIRDRRVQVEVAAWAAGPGDYARKINLGVKATEEPWLLQAGDDIRFHPGWAEEALRVAAASGARVIGTNDLGNPRTIRGRHSTHSLVARAYVEERGTLDAAGLMLHEGYEHNYVDDELVWTAQRRGEYAPAPGCRIEHLHPSWGKAAGDATYDRGRDGFDRDRRRWTVRQQQWRRGRRG